MSHDLRTPLTAILAAGEAVRSESIGPREREELGALVVEEAQRLSRLIDKLLDLSRLQAGEAEARRDWCSIEEVVEGALEHVDAAVPVEVTLDRDLPLVQADAGAARARDREPDRERASTSPAAIRSSSARA